MRHGKSGSIKNENTNGEGEDVSVDMNVVILAGGVGTRLVEETEIKPKPMVEIGGKPILWHILKHYSHYGYQNFIIALGYKGEHIKKYFIDGIASKSKIPDINDRVLLIFILLLLFCLFGLRIFLWMSKFVCSPNDKSNYGKIESICSHNFSTCKERPI